MSTVKIDGMAVEYVMRREGNGWSAWIESLGFIVSCEECDTVVGHGETIRDAANDAFDNNAVTDGGDEGSGNTYCAVCYDRLWNEAYNDAMRTYEADFYTRAAQAVEDEREAFLAAADLAFDIAREEGRI